MYDKWGINKLPCLALSNLWAICVVVGASRVIGQEALVGPRENAYQPTLSVRGSVSAYVIDYGFS